MNANEPESVTVITVTRRRPELLARCVRSVALQDFRGAIKHLVIADDCQETAAAVSGLAAGGKKLRCVVVERLADERGGPPRLAKLRNLAASLADTPWLAFLDDDNEFEPEHVRTLFERAAATESPAVYSHRRLFHADGRPFLEQFWPWCRDPAEARERYRKMVRLGVMSPGSNVVRDRVETRPGREPLLLVDTNVWLLRTELLLEYPIPVDFSYQDWLDNLAEDDKLVERLVGAGVPIECTDLATVRYYLGGYSNDFAGRSERSERWPAPRGDRGAGRAEDF